MGSPGRAVAAVLLVVALLASGCVAQDPPGRINHTQIPPNAPSEVGDGNFDLRIVVVAETPEGPRLEGAPVSIFPIKNRLAPPGIHELRRSNASYAARTDENGEVRAHLIAGRYYSFLASYENLTVEMRHLIRMDSKYADQPLYIVLLNATRHLEITGKFPANARPNKIPGCAGSCVGTAVTSLTNVTFHPQPNINREYNARLKYVKVTLTWQNSPSEFGDLGVRAGFFGTTEWWEADTQTTRAGSQSVPYVYVPVDPGLEQLELKSMQLAQAIQKRDPRFQTGAITRQPVVTQDGLDFKVVVEAEFNTDPPERCATYCYDPNRVYEPGFELAFAAIGLLGVGLFLRRRGR